jgi:hypothetical protein
MTSPHTPPIGHCVFCSYEIRTSAGPVPMVPVATSRVETPRGPRDLCASHAEKLAWESRGRRVSASW